jgi:hypothetical protein
MKYSLLIIFLIFGCDGTLEKEREKVTVPEPPKIEIVNIFEGPNKIDEAGTKMMKPDKKVEIVPEKPIKITPVYKECPKPKPVKKYKFNKAKYIKKGYKESRHYGHSPCRGIVYEKEFTNSFFYLFVDCSNNYTTQRIRK